jgi:hypothetical protein
MSLVTDVLRELGDAGGPSTLDALSGRLRRDPRDVIAALSVLECQGLALRARDRYVVSRLGRRALDRPPTHAVR